MTIGVRALTALRGKQSAFPTHHHIAVLTRQKTKTADLGVRPTVTSVASTTADRLRPESHRAYRNRSAPAWCRHQDRGKNSIPARRSPQSHAPETPKTSGRRD